MSKRFLLCGVMLFFVSHTSLATPPVVDKSPYRFIPETYRVQKGDSIYTLAWKYGVDYENIAKLNGLKKPYKLRPNQTLRLTRNAAKLKSSGTVVKEIRPSSQSTTKSTPALTQSLVKTSTSKSLTQLPTPKLQALKPAIGAAVALTPKKKVASIAKTNTKPTNTTPTKWLWPAQGKLTEKFSVEKGINGIQIVGKSGSPITATAAGEVVYVGEGLRGYGKLVILKHSDKFLSAYAHNKDIFVQEGDGVRAGQKIASMGNSGSDTTMSHFEIRKQGEPVNPLKYLPKRG